MSNSGPLAVVFDMDGIIFDTEPLWLEAETELVARRGHVFQPLFARQLMGVPGPAAMQMLIEHFRLTEEPLKLAAELNKIFHGLLETRLTLMEGVLDRFQMLEERGVPKGVATSTEGTLARWMLGRAGLLDRLEFILSRDDVSRGKPHPEIYSRSCELLKTPPSETLVFEDSLAGTQSARQAGCVVVAVRHPLMGDADFPDADLVVSHHRDSRIDDLWSA